MQYKYTFRGVAPEDSTTPKMPNVTVTKPDGSKSIMDEDQYVKETFGTTSPGARSTSTRSRPSSGSSGTSTTSTNQASIILARYNPPVAMSESDEVKYGAPAIITSSGDLADCPPEHEMFRARLDWIGPTLMTAKTVHLIWKNNDTGTTLFLMDYVFQAGWTWGYA